LQLRHNFNPLAFRNLGQQIGYQILQPALATLHILFVTTCHTAEHKCRENAGIRSSDATNLVESVGAMQAQMNRLRNSFALFQP
jgi:hypothetical protein